VSKAAQMQQPGVHVRPALIGIAVAFGLLAVWVVVCVVLLGLAARSVQQQSEQAASAARSGNVADIEAALTGIQESAATMDSRAQALPLRLLAGLPWAGSSIRTVQGMAAGTNSLALATVGQEPAIANAANTLKEEGMSGAAALSELTPFTTAAVAQMAPATAAVSADQPAWPFDQVIDKQRRQYLDLASGMVSADALTRSLPTLLGADGKRRWAVIFQNDAEQRGTGGLISSYALVNVDSGKFTPVAADTTNSFADEAVSLQGIPADTKKLWGQDLAFSYGWNLDRHFPFAGALSYRGMTELANVDIDDMVSMDGRAVAAILAVAGPIKSGGITIDGTNAADYFARKIYEDFPDQERKDQVTVKLLSAAMKALTKEDLKVQDLWEGLGQVATEGRLLVYSSDDQVQKQLERLPSGGVVPDQPGPWTTVAVNDFAGSKMGAYLQVTADYESAAECTDEQAQSQLTLTVTNTAPADLPEYVDIRNDEGGRDRPAGSTKFGVSFYAPVGAAFRSAMRDGETTEMGAGASRDRPVWSTVIDLERGETTEVVVAFAEPKGFLQEPQFSAQPMVNTMAVTAHKGGC